MAAEIHFQKKKKTSRIYKKDVSVPGEVFKQPSRKNTNVFKTWIFVGLNLDPLATDIWMHKSLCCGSGTLPN